MSSFASTNTRFYTPLLLAAGLVVLIFFIRPWYTQYVANTETVVWLTSQNTAATEKLKELHSLDDELKNEKKNGSGTTLKERVLRYNRSFAPEDILDAVLLNDMTRAGDGGNYQVIIKNIAIDKGSKLPSGMSLGRVTFSLDATSIEKIVDFAEMLLSHPKVAFSLDNLTLPYSTLPNKQQNIYTVSLSLGFYYFEK